MPSPLGEGQTNTPINHLNQGEVLTPGIEKEIISSFIGESLPTYHPPDGLSSAIVQILLTPLRGT
jgi:hypothetical protein